MTRMAADRNAWYHDTGPELHLSDFVFLTHMQTAHHITKQTTRIPSHNMVLERLLAEGTFNRREADPLHAGEAFVMNHALAMVQHLLMRIEVIEADVSPLYDAGRPFLAHYFSSFIVPMSCLKSMRRN